MYRLYPAYFFQNEDRSYTVEFPDLNGCITQGDNLKDAFIMAVDAATGWIELSLLEGEELPLESANIPSKPDAETHYILVSIDPAKRSLSVKKNTTIPAWIAEKAEKQNINFSQTLQEALVKKLGL
ncbi:type II toxin-antitoxin system HicB family antitoxin [Guggenheimella bovis]